MGITIAHILDQVARITMWGVVVYALVVFNATLGLIFGIAFITKIAADAYVDMKAKEMAGEMLGQFKKMMVEEKKKAQDESDKTGVSH